jgi:hypothetical protein
MKTVSHPGKGSKVEIGRERDESGEHCNRYNEPLDAEVFLVSVRSLARPDRRLRRVSVG